MQIQVNSDDELENVTEVIAINHPTVSFYLCSQKAQFQQIIVLILDNCNLKTLNGLPIFKTLKFLSANNNYLHEQSFRYLKQYKGLLLELQLKHNQFNYNDFELDLKLNALTLREPDKNGLKYQQWRTKIFMKFPTLKYLDGEPQDVTHSYGLRNKI